MLRPWGWACEQVILLCLQAVGEHIEMRWERPWFWPFRKMLVSRGDKVPTYIPKANEFARKVAQIAEGSAKSTIPEILFDVPHPLHRRLRHCRFSRPRRGQRPPSRLRLPQYVHL
jgi:cholesterol oxidase